VACGRKTCGDRASRDRRGPIRNRTLWQAFVDERGATLALFAVSLTALLAVMALAIDLGMLLTARTEAQRAADSAALAGAQEFLKRPPAEAEPFARQHAYEYALYNAIRQVKIDSSEVRVEIVQARRLVRVTISRRTVSTWFARIFGIDAVPIAAVAAAEASPAGSVKCLKPFAVPDLWHDRNDDLNGNGVADEGEDWTYEPGIDDYAPTRGDLGPCLSSDGTGYGSCLRGPDRDYGRQIKIKVTDPNDPDQIAPSFFFPVQLATDGSVMDDCGSGGGEESGASAYRKNICSCNERPFGIGDTLRVEPGNMVGPTHQGVESLIERDPDAYWDAGSRRVRGSRMGEEWMSSPRVVKVVLFAPDQIHGSSDKFLVANNFALVFIEEQQNRKDPVTSRFLYFAQGDGTTSAATGSLVRVIRLIE
jgi:hypothetical protein